MKSFGAGLHCWLKARFHPLWEANILGGSQTQSKKAYEATDIFWRRTDDIKGRHVLDGEPLVTVTRFQNGAKYELGTASTRTQLGPHPNKLIGDEIDEMPVVVFNAAMMQPMTKNGHPASWQLMSTMHKVGGLMADWVDNAAIRGYRAYKWCILEVMESCEDYHCSTCGLVEWCKGRMKPKIEEVRIQELEEGIIEHDQKAIMGFNTVEDVIRKVKQGSVEEETEAGKMVVPIDIEADLFCQRPSRIGLVFKEFSESLHIKSETDIVINPNWPVYRTTDFGFTNPFVCLWFTITPSDVWIFFQEYVERGIIIQRHCDMMVDDQRKRKVQATIADPSGADEKATMRANGIYVSEFDKLTIAEGLQHVRKLLEPREDGSPQFIISTACPVTRYEFTKGYKYPDSGLSENPVDSNNHCMEAIRRAVVAWKQGKLSNLKTLMEGVKTGSGKRYETTTATEEFEKSKKALKKLRQSRIRSSHRQRNRL